jgi:uncharacterized protein
MEALATILWQRLDAPGHDACRLEHHGDSLQLEGAAVFRLTDGRIAQLQYRVRCDQAFHTRWGTVRGWLGSKTIDLAITRSARGAWTLNDVAVPHLDHCLDLDLGFSPATNLLPLRRLKLHPGEAADAPAAWIDLDGAGLEELQQRYERRGEHQYGYCASRFGYEAVLEVTAEGFVRDYPGLWSAAT